MGWLVQDGLTPVAGCWLATSRGNGDNWPVCLLSSSKASTGLFTWSPQGYKRASRSLGSQPSQGHIHHILLAKASHKVSPGSIGREVDSTSWQEELQSCVKGVDTRKSKGLLVVVTSYYRIFLRCREQGCPILGYQHQQGPRPHSLLPSTNLLGGRACRDSIASHNSLSLGQVGLCFPS